jgi:hypothetical protein
LPPVPTEDLTTGAIEKRNRAVEKGLGEYGDDNIYLPIKLAGSSFPGARRSSCTSSHSCNQDSEPSTVWTPVLEGGEYVCANETRLDVDLQKARRAVMEALGDAWLGSAEAVKVEEVLLGVIRAGKGNEM